MRDTVANNWGIAKGRRGGEEACVPGGHQQATGFARGIGYRAKGVNRICWTYYMT